MIINRHELFEASPIRDMKTHKVIENGVSHGLGEAGYDIRIKQDVWFYPARYHAWDRSTVRLPRHKVGLHSPTQVGTFCLASTIEEFAMPNDLVGVVHDKSTWARQGLSVFNTVIEPGWKGFLTLELVYHGREDLFIPAGAGIAQVLFHRTAEACGYTGKYQNQADKPVPSVFQ